jgi:site-specific recombinase XerD
MSSPEYALLQIPVAPFQFPSLEHLDNAVERGITRMVSLNAVRAETTAIWARQSYRGFRRYLKEHAHETSFVRGDLQAQVAVLESWIMDMRERGMRRGGINATWRGLASAFRWLTRECAMTNPMLFVETPTVGRLQPEFLTKEAAEAVLRFVRNYQWPSEFERRRNTVIVGLMVLAGFRRGEVIRLQRGDVNIRASRAKIRLGKGPNGGSDRTTYLPPQLRDYIAEYLEELDAMPPRRHGELLTSLRNQPISSGLITRLFGTITRQSSIRVAPHMLRHTYATLLRQSGVDDRVAMELMGHSDLRMLLRYSHVEAEEPARAAERLELRL